MRVDVTEQFIPVVVRVSLSSSFFDDNPITDVDNIIIIQEIFDDEGLLTETITSSLAEEAPGTGIYIPDPTFDMDQRIPVSRTNLDILYTIILDKEGRRYAGQTKYVTSVPIDNLEIGDGQLFDEESTELIVTFTDDPDKDNYYLFDFGFGEFLTTEDRFFNRTRRRR